MMLTSQFRESRRTFLQATLPFPSRFVLLQGFWMFALAALASFVQAQERPYIVTYNHYLEEPGNLEMEYFSTFGTQRGGNAFHPF